MTQDAGNQLLEHFGLKAWPFETAPDPRLFLPAPTHSEALALIEYAVHAGKGCAAIAGASGSGKTLLARMAFRECIRQDRDVLWVDAIGQPADATEATRYSPRLVTSNGGPGREETTLEAWARSDARAARSLVIVDDADALSRRGWTDLISLMTRDARALHPATTLLLGLPVLLKRLAAPGMLRIRRRMFRALRLEPLDEGWLRRYLENRVKEAGGALDSLFEDDALDGIGAMTGGNPGLVNQLCESALLNAFADGERRICLAHVEAAADATLLGPFPASSETSPTVEVAAQAAQAAQAAEGTMSANHACAPLDTEMPATRAGEAADSSAVAQATRPVSDLAPLPPQQRKPTTSRGLGRGEPKPPVAAVPADVLNQLDALEARVLRVLAAVQDVVSVTHEQPEANAPNRLFAEAVVP